MAEHTVEKNEVSSCVGCQQIPDEFIALQCSHDFCLPCLAYTYLQFLNEQKSEPSRVMLQCSLCKQYTQMDNHSISALEEVLQQIFLQQQVNMQLKQNQEYKPEVILEESQEQQTRSEQEPFSKNLQDSYKNNGSIDICSYQATSNKKKGISLVFDNIKCHEQISGQDTNEKINGLDIHDKNIEVDNQDKKQSQVNGSSQFNTSFASKGQSNRKFKSSQKSLERIISEMVKPQSYCFTCETLIYKKQESQHRFHDYKSIEIASQQRKKVLIQKHNDNEIHHKNYQKIIEQQKQVESQCSLQKQQVNRIYYDMQSILKNHFETLISKIESFQSYKQTLLKQHQMQLEPLLEENIQLQEVIESNLPEEILKFETKTFLDYEPFPQGFDQYNISQAIVAFESLKIMLQSPVEQQNQKNDYFAIDQKKISPVLFQEKFKLPDNLKIERRKPENPSFERRMVENHNFENHPYRITENITQRFQKNNSMDQRLFQLKFQRMNGKGVKQQPNTTRFFTQDKTLYPSDYTKRFFQQDINLYPSERSFFNYNSTDSLFNNFNVQAGHIMTNRSDFLRNPSYRIKNLFRSPPSQFNQTFKKYFAKKY